MYSFTDAQLADIVDSLRDSAEGYANGAEALGQDNDAYEVWMTASAWLNLLARSVEVNGNDADLSNGDLDDIYAALCGSVVNCMELDLTDAQAGYQSALDAVEKILV